MVSEIHGAPIGPKIEPPPLLGNQGGGDNLDPLLDKMLHHAKNLHHHYKGVGGNLALNEGKDGTSLSLSLSLSLCVCVCVCVFMRIN
jgi:hypothetical protein